MSATAIDAFDDLRPGDRIQVPQYANPLTVQTINRAVGMIGVEFDRPTGAVKHLVQNENSGRVYLVAGTSDKGEVNDIEVLN